MSLRISCLQAPLPQTKHRRSRQERCRPSIRPDAQPYQFTGHERDTNGTAAALCGDPPAPCQGFDTVDGVLSGTERYAAGIELKAGPDVTVASGADVTFRAGERVVISGEFTVEAGATFVAENEAELGGVAVELDYMHARYYSPGIGRFLSIDPINSAVPNKPQSWNKYPYVFNNPLKWVDPNGECAAPAGLAEGQVGVCIESFIAAKRIGGIGLGDSRTFESNDPSATARVSFKMIVDPQTGQVVGEPSTVAGVSKVGLNETLSVGRKGTASALFLNAPDTPSNTTQFSIFLSGRNGLSALNNLGTINALVNLSIDQQGGVKAGGVTRGFPSIEGYAYRIVDGQLVIQILFKYPEEDLNDLNGPMDRELRASP